MSWGEQPGLSRWTNLITHVLKEPVPAVVRERCDYGRESANIAGFADGARGPEPRV